MTRSPADASKSFQSNTADDPSSDERIARLLHGSQDALRFVREFARLGALRRIGLGGSHYNPNQPRVPAGNPDGGQWTSAGGGGPRLATRDKGGSGGGILFTIVTKFFLDLIDAYRSENGLWDLFGQRRGTVTVTTFKGKHIFGSNSRSPTYTRADRTLAEGMRRILIQKYPEVMKSDNIGQKPNDALFHAEATVLLRAARENAGTLAGQTLEVTADGPMCGSCLKVLPKLGVELGNPTVTFVDDVGLRRTMRNGKWDPE
jgi:hypothetical protein